MNTKHTGSDIQLGESHRKERIPLSVYFPLLFAVCWLGVLPMILSSRGIELSPPVRALQLLMLFGPVSVTLFTAYRNDGRAGVMGLLRGLVRWRNHPLLYAAVLVGPSLIFLASLAIGKAMGATEAPIPSFMKFLSSFGMTLGMYLILNTEEIAWRGYALPRLQARMGVLPATALIGILWLLFHLPLFWLKGGHPAGYPFWLFSFLILSITLSFTSIYNATGGSILMAHLLHQSFNAAVEAIPLYPAASHSIVPTIISVVLCVGLSIVLLVRKMGFVPPVASAQSSLS